MPISAGRRCTACSAASLGAGAGVGGSLPFGLAAVQASPRLTVLVSSGPVADPTAALTSGALKTLLESARASFDWVIIDTPPIGLMSDAKLLADMADGGDCRGPGGA